MGTADTPIAFRKAELTLIGNVPIGVTLSSSVDDPVAAFAVGNSLRTYPVDDFSVGNLTPHAKITFSNMVEVTYALPGNVVAGTQDMRVHFFDSSDPQNLVPRGVVDLDHRPVYVAAKDKYLLFSEGSFRSTLVHYDPPAVPVVERTEDWGGDFALLGNFLLSARGFQVQTIDWTNAADPVDAGSSSIPVTGIARYDANRAVGIDASVFYSIDATDKLALAVDGNLQDFSGATLVGVPEDDSRALSVAVRRDFAGAIVTFLDMTDPQDPTVVSEVTIGQSFELPTSLAFRGSKAFVSLATGTYVLDFTDLSNITILGPLNRGGDNRDVQWDPRSSVAYGVADGWGVLAGSVTLPGGGVEPAGSYEVPESFDEFLVRMEFPFADSSQEQYWLAVAAGTQGMAILNVTDPANILELRRTGTGGTAQAVAVAGAYAYFLVGFTAEVDLQTWDISQATNIRRVDELSLTGLAPNEIVAEGDRLYVASNDLHVLDISTPDHPQLLGSLGATDVRAVEVVGTTAYLGRGLGGLQVLDVSDPQSMLELGYVDLGSDVFIEGIDVVGTSTPVMSEDGARQVSLVAIIAGGPAGVLAADVTDPQNMVELSRFDTADVAFSTSLRGRYVLVADGYSGYYLLELTDAVPVLLQDFDVNATDAGVVLRWDVVDDGNITGFRILRMETRQPDATMRETASLQSGARSYVDSDVLPETAYRYQLAIVNNRDEILSHPVTLKTPALRTRVEPSYPNPFNPSTTVVFHLARPQNVSLKIYDVRGTRVATLIADEPFGSGRHEVVWRGNDERGRSVASGVYEYRLTTSKRTFTGKMTLVR